MFSPAGRTTELELCFALKIYMTVQNDLEGTKSAMATE